MKIVCGFLFAFCAVANCRATQVEVGDWRVNYYGGSESTRTVTLEKYLGSSTSVTIPDSLSIPVQEWDDKDREYKTVYRSFKVALLASSVFAWNSNLKSITINAKIDLSTSAFKSCSSLESVVGLGNVTSIGDYAFANCIGLTGAFDLSSVREIRSSAFQGCTGITEFRGLSKVQYVGGSAFQGCTNIVAMEFGDSVATVEGYAFYGCTSLRSAIFGSGLRTLGAGVFADCASLKSVELGNGLRSLGYGVFMGCTSLETIEINGDGLDLTQAQCLFEDCTHLRRVVFGDGVTRLPHGGQAAYGRYDPFNRCTALEEVLVGSGVTEIPACFLSGATHLGQASFAGSITVVGTSNRSLSSLTNLTIHLSHCVVDGGAFSSCPGVTTESVDFSEIVSIGFGSYNWSGAFSGCTNIRGSVDLSCCTEIGESAFYGCSGITRVSFSENLVSLGKSSFANCTSLSEVYFRGGVPSGGSTSQYDQSFSGCAPGARGYYLPAHAAEWEAVISENHMWNNLIMVPLQQPKLTVSSVSWTDGTISLDWSKTEDGHDVCWPCEIWRATMSDFSDEVCIASNLDAAAEHRIYTDSEFLSAKPQTAPLYYRAKPKMSGGDASILRDGNSVVTRRRFGLLVSFDAYEGEWVEAFPSMMENINQLKTALESSWSRNVGDISVLPNPQTGNVLTAKIKDYADRTSKGDLFFLWIDTHGWYDVKRGEGEILTSTSLAMFNRDEGLTSTQLEVALKDFESVAVVPVVSACHSEKMVTFDGGEWTDREYAESLVNGFYGQCRADVAGLASCALAQTSPGTRENGEADPFARFFIDGLFYGAADETRDCAVTFAELVAYIQRQQGLFTPDSIAVAYDPAGLLAKIVLAENNSWSHDVAPETPQPKEYGEDCFAWTKSGKSHWYAIHDLVSNEWWFRYVPFIWNRLFSHIKKPGYPDVAAIEVYAGNMFGRSAEACRFEFGYASALGAVRDLYATGSDDDPMCFGDARYKEIRVSWSRLKDADGYRIDRSDGDTIETTEVEISDDDISLWNGAEFSYTITPYYSEAGGVKVYGTPTNVTGRADTHARFLVSPTTIRVPAQSAKTYSVSLDANMDYAVEIQPNDGAVTLEEEFDARIDFRMSENVSAEPRTYQLLFHPGFEEVGVVTVTVVQDGTLAKPSFRNFGEWCTASGATVSEMYAGCDKDVNGIADILEYAFQDSKELFSAKLCTIEMVSGKPIITIPKQNPYTYSEVQTILESSSDLKSWANANAEIENSEMTADGYERRTMGNLGDRGFYRLKMKLR